MAALKVADLYCGGGGFSEGFRQAGFKIVLGVDMWDTALETYAANQGAETLCADITTLDPETLPRVDVLIGGPPCQDLSVANSKKDIKRGVVNVRHFLELARALRPRWWVGENVPGLLYFASHILQGVPHKETLNAADFGVPQVRRRVFYGRFPSPEQTHAESPTSTFGGKSMRKWVSVREALRLDAVSGDLLTLKNTKRYAPKPRGLDKPSFTVLGGRWNMAIADGLNPPNTRADGTQHRLVWVDDYYTNDAGDGPRVTDVTDRPALTIDARRGGRPRVGWVARDRPSPAVVATEFKGATGPNVANPGHTYQRASDYYRELTGARKLTVAECAILQGFPDGYKVAGTLAQQYAQVGNAVAPPVVRAIAESIALEDRRR